MKSILIIEDDKLVLGALTRALRSTFIVSACEGVRDAIGLVTSGQRFDVILCDMFLEDGTGRDVFDHFVKQSVDQANRILFLSGREVDDERTSDAFEKSTRGRHMTKPCATRELIERTLGVASSEGELVAA